MSCAPVNRVIRTSFVDGPGNRSAIFLQGCNLQCAYCHNPETWTICDGCGICVDSCKTGALVQEADKVLWNRELCVECDACINHCKQGASPRIKWMNPQEIIEEIGAAIHFIRGITVSGGECSLYPEFLTELFTLARGDYGLNCLMDSNGMVLYKDYPELMNVCDGVMLDVKAWDLEVHRKLTGFSNENVMENLQYLIEIGKLVELRIVCVSEEVDVLNILDKLSRISGVNKKNLLIKLIRFRNNGVRGRLETAESPSDEVMGTYHECAVRLGFEKVRIIG